MDSLQGVQSGNAFSIVITEITGDMSIAIATEAETAVSFGACLEAKPNVARS